MNRMLRKLGWKEGMSFLVRDMPDDLLDTFIPPYDKEEAGIELTFVLNTERLKENADQIMKAPEGSRVWVAYPKKSGRIKTDISRDHGWAPLTENDWRPVAQVAIDEDWSALRFRPAEEVKVKSSVRRGEASPQQYLDPPLELEEKFREYPEAARFYYSLAPSHKKEYNRWIMEAKREETRERRLEKTIELLLNDKKNPY